MSVVTHTRTHTHTRWFPWMLSVCEEPPHSEDVVKSSCSRIASGHSFPVLWRPLLDACVNVAHTSRSQTIYLRIVTL